MSKTFKVITGIDFPPLQRREPGETVTDEELPEESVKWLLECGAIVPHKKPKKEKAAE